MKKIAFFNEMLVFIFISALTLIDERRVIGHLITGFLRKVRILVVVRFNDLHQFVFNCVRKPILKF